MQIIPSISIAIYFHRDRVGRRKEAGCRRDDVEVDVWGDEDGQDTK